LNFDVEVGIRTPKDFPLATLKTEIPSQSSPFMDERILSESFQLFDIQSKTMTVSDNFLLNKKKLF